MKDRIQTLQESLDLKAKKKMDDDIDDLTRSIINLIGYDLNCVYLKYGDGYRKASSWELASALKDDFIKSKTAEYKVKEVVLFTKEFEQMRNQFDQLIGFDQADNNE